MRKISIIAGILFLLTAAGVRADSPVTSTPFYDAYLDIEAVKNAHEANALTDETVRFLLSNARIDQKAAVINALGWGKGYSEAFQLKLAKARKKTSFSGIGMNEFTAGELFCIGYMQLMDDYFNPQKALPWLEKAQQLMPRSYTVNMVAMLAKAQAAMDQDFCQVWKLAEALQTKRRLKKDLRKDAITIVFDYLVLYKEYC